MAPNQTKSARPAPLVDPPRVPEALVRFAAESTTRQKGFLALMLLITEKALTAGLPLDADSLLTTSGGQVKGAGKAPVQTILRRFGITKTLAQEGSRTSRGSIANMRNYVMLLNAIHEQDSTLEVKEIQRFWVSKVKVFFDAQPFKLSIDESKTLRHALRALMKVAEDRQRQAGGAMLVRTVMQHLVGAKLEIVFGPGSVRHHGANESDQDPSRSGDFDIGDASIHVSSHPTESLLEKCKGNIEANKRPIIVTTRERVGAAENNAALFGIEDRVEVIEFEQFLVANLHEHGKFESKQRSLKTGELIAPTTELLTNMKPTQALRSKPAKKNKHPETSQAAFPYPRICTTVAPPPPSFWGASVIFSTWGWVGSQARRARRSTPMPKPWMTRMRGSPAR